MMENIFVFYCDKLWVQSTFYSFSIISFRSNIIHPWLVLLLSRACQCVFSYFACLPYFALQVLGPTVATLAITLIPDIGLE